MTAKCLNKLYPLINISLNKIIHQSTCKKKLREGNVQNNRFHQNVVFRMHAFKIK